MSNYIITRYFESSKEQLEYEVNTLNELDRHLGEFVAIYSAMGTVNVQNGRMDALDENGNFRTSIAWTVKD